MTNKQVIETFIAWLDSHECRGYHDEHLDTYDGPDGYCDYEMSHGVEIEAIKDKLMELIDRGTMTNDRRLTDAEIQEATGKFPEIPGAKFWVGDELKLALDAQNSKTAASMQVELNELQRSRDVIITHRQLVAERLEAERDDLRAKGQVLADAAENMLKENSGVAEWAAIRQTIADWNA